MADCRKCTIELLKNIYITESRRTFCNPLQKDKRLFVMLTKNLTTFKNRTPNPLHQLSVFM